MPVPVTAHSEVDDTELNAFLPDSEQPVTPPVYPRKQARN